MKISKVLNAEGLKMLVAGVLVVSAIGGISGSIGAYADSEMNKDDISVVETEGSNKISISDYFKDYGFLSDEEKARLLETEKEAQPQHDRLDEIDREIDALSDKILASAEGLFDERDNILSKLNEDEDIDKLSPEDMAKLDAIEDELEKKYEEIEAVSRGYEEEIDRLFEEIEKIEEKNKDIWDKIDANDTEPVLY